VIHRDLKPANIMVEGDTPVIMDFGIARSALQHVEGKAISSTQLSRSALLTGATMQGAVVGTVAYMSPEQAKGQPADQRSDIYAVGMIMRDMLVGMRDVENPTDALTELMERVAHAPKPVLEIDPAIPPHVDRIVTRCLQPDAAARYQNVGELLSDLNALDAQGVPLPKIRQLTKRFVGIAAGVVLVLLGVTWWLAQPPPEVVQPPNTSVLIADFENRAGESVFDGAVEQALGIAMEEASFITVYPRRDAVQAAAEIKPGSRLDERTARLVSAREGIKIILAGSIAQEGNAYTISVRALDPALDPAKSEPLAVESASFNSKDAVLTAIGPIASRLRDALGDTTPESARLAAAETVTASSLEAMGAYARAQELAATNKIPDALKTYESAIALDPRFGRAFAGMGVIYANTKQEDKARASYEQALKHVDRMTEREKFRTLGTYYLLVARNYEKAVENFESLVRLYPADDVGHANLALAYLHLGNLPRAVGEVKQTLDIYPKDFLSRYNYAMYSMYAGDFQTSAAEGARVLKESPLFVYAFIPIALSNAARGDVAAASEAYMRLEQVGQDGHSLASLGKADLEMYFGRMKQAVRILREGIAADEKGGNSGETAQKHVAMAEAYLALGQGRRAAEAATRAAALSSNESVLFPAARALILAGREDQAEKIATKLENMLQRQTVAYARLISGEIAIKKGRLAAGMEALREGQKRHDSWMSRFVNGRAYFEAGHFPEALAEFELCLKRRGEATDVFFYDTPTLRYFPPVYYWLARTQQQLGVTAEAKQNYDHFLALRAETDHPDPLAADARRRLKSP